MGLEWRRMRRFLEGGGWGIEEVGMGMVRLVGGGGRWNEGFVFGKGGVDIGGD